MKRCGGIGARRRQTFVLAGAAIAALFLAAQPASALPSYARQTGQQCAACHNGFPS